MAHRRDQKQKKTMEEDKREQLLVIWTVVPGKLQSKRVRPKIIMVELMQPTPTRQTRMMECRITTRRQGISKSFL
jgi:hypothetical protein